MTTRTISGQFADPNSGGINGAVITVWAASRFSSDPVFEDAPPSGVADFTANAAVAFGKPGGWRIDVDAFTDYWVLDTYNGHAYWTFNGGNADLVPVSSMQETLAYNGDGTIHTVTETATGAVTTYTYNTDGTVATESRLLNGVTTLRTFVYSGGNLVGVS